jgi:DNA-binding PadR family transcriptional regulator
MIAASTAPCDASKQLELVDDSERPGERTGADRKYYQLTATGRNVLEAFLDRHIRGVYFTGSTGLFT